MLGQKCRPVSLVSGNIRYMRILSLSLLFPVRGACHRPNRLQKVQHASRVGRIQVAGGGRSTCLHVGRTAQEQMLCCLVVASAVWAQWRLLSPDSV